MKLKIIYEDNHIIICNKVAGILSQGDSSGDVSLLDEVKAYLKNRYSKPGNVYCGLVHRLDKPVSGLIIFAKTSKAAQRMHSIFLSRNITKLYIARVTGDISQTMNWVHIHNHLVRKRGFSEIYNTPRNTSKEASLSYRILQSTNNSHLLLVSLNTGRKHQIRAQLAYIGLPIDGDNQYGSKITFSAHRIALHSLYLYFSHPVKKEPMEMYSEPEAWLTDGFNEEYYSLDTIKLVLEEK